MAINPADITTVRVDQLASDAITLTSLLPHQVGTDLKQDTVQALVDLVATAIGAGSGVGYLPISVTDGQQLPAVPADPSFFLCGAGTYLNINGFPNVVCTGELNAVMSLSDHWELAVEIPIVAEVGVQTVTGSAVDNTDPLNPVVNLNTPTLQQVTDEGNVVEYPAETTFAKYQTSADVFAQIASDGDGYVNFEVSQAVGEKTIYGNGAVIGEGGGNSFALTFTNGIVGKFGVLDETITASSFTALNYFKYNVNGTITVTDPTPVINQGYVVHVIGGTTTIGGVVYTSGALVYRFYNGTSWVSKNYDLTASNLHTFVDALTALTTPADADRMIIVDNSASLSKKITWANIKASLKTYFDTFHSTIIVRIITPSSALTGTTSETQITSFNFTIPANTFSANDILKVETIAWEKAGVANSSSCRLKLSNTNNYAGSSNVLILAASGGNINMRGTRTYKIAGGNLKGFMSSSANGIFNDNTLSSVAVSTLALDVTQPIYGFISLQNSSSADSTIMNELIISKW